MVKKKSPSGTLIAKQESIYHNELKGEGSYEELIDLSQTYNKM